MAKEQNLPARTIILRSKAVPEGDGGLSPEVAEFSDKGGMLKAKRSDWERE